MRTVSSSGKARRRVRQRTTGWGGEALPVADTPQSLTLKENRDATEVYELGARRVFFALLTIVLLLGVANTFGQSPTGSEVESAAARLEVSAPVDVRGGLHFQVNPNNLGRKSQDVRLYDDTELLAKAQRDVKIWPLAHGHSRQGVLRL